MQNSHYLPGLVYQPCFLSAVFYNKSKVTNMKEAQQGNYRAYGAKSGVDGYPWDYDYWSTCGARNIEEKNDENFPRRSCNWGKVSSLGQLLGRRRSTQVVDSRKNSTLEQNIRPKNIVYNHMAKKKYCLQTYGQEKILSTIKWPTKKYCLQSFGQQKILSTIIWPTKKHSPKKNIVCKSKCSILSILARFLEVPGPVAIVSLA